MLLSADAVYLTEFQYEALKKFLFFRAGRKIIEKRFVYLKQKYYLYFIKQINSMEKNMYQAIEIARQIQVQNENLRNAIAFLKNITHSGVISDQKNNGDIIGISNELKSEISSMIDKLDKCNIYGYDCNQIIEKHIKE